MSTPRRDTKGDFFKTTLHLSFFRFVLEDGVAQRVLQILIQLALPREATTDAEGYTADVFVLGH